MATKGFTLHVLQPAHQNDGTNHGVSATASTLTLVGIINYGIYHDLPAECAVAEPHPTRSPAVLLQIQKVYSGLSRRYASGMDEGDRLDKVCNLVPARLDHNGKYVKDFGWHMAGGNFAHSHDSRLQSVLEDVLGHRFYGAISIHDRVEQDRVPYDD